MGSNIGDTVWTFFRGRKALKTEDKGGPRKLGWWILFLIPCQLCVNYAMLVNLAHLDGIAEIAQTNTFKLAYFVTFFVFTGYELFVAILAIRATPRPRTERV